MAGSDREAATAIASKNFRSIKFIPMTEEYVIFNEQLRPPAHCRAVRRRVGFADACAFTSFCNRSMTVETQL